MSAIFANRVRSAAAAAVRGVVVGLAAIAALASVQAWAQGANSLDQVAVSKGTSGRTIVKFTLRNPPANAPAGFAIANPPRIALDFLDTANGLGATQRQVDDAALRTAGVQDVPAPGSCVTSFDIAPSTARGVELLDVGAVTVDAFVGDPAQGKTTILLPRAMPDPAGVVSGYFYSARASEAYTPTSRLSLRASGGQDLPEGFAVSVASPRDLSDVRVVATPASVDVLWDSSESDGRDLVYADVLAPAMIARCAGSDAGHLAIPASALGAAEEGTIAVHRVHREPFRTRGIDPGEVRFDFARVVSFRR